MPRKKSGSTLTLPYSLSRWDFGTREGDVAYYARKTGFKLKRGKRTATAINPRLVLDTPKSGYISMLISNERIKFFTVSGAKAKAADRGNVQQTTGYTLKLTQAGANYVNRALRKKALKRFSQFGTLDVRIIRPAAATPQPGVPSTPGDRRRHARPGRHARRLGHDQPGPDRPDPRRRFRHAADPGGRDRPRRRRQGRRDRAPARGRRRGPGLRTGTIKLGGGIILDLPGLGTRAELVNPEIILGTDAGLYAHVNGVRVKVGDIDTNDLDINLLDGTVTIKQLHVNLGGGMLNNVLAPVLGALGIPASTPILNLDLSFPDL